MSEQQAFPRLDTPFTQDSSGQIVPDSNAVNVKGGLLAIPWYRVLITLWNRTGGANGNVSGIQPGGMYGWTGDPTTPPQGTLFCDGTAVSRSQYSELFTAIGVRWGAGDGDTTFNLPNIKDKVIIGAGPAHPVASTGGDFILILDETQLPVIVPVVNDPGHFHGQNVASNNAAGTTGTQGGTAADNTIVGQTDTDPTGITISPFGGGAPIDITPSYIAIPWVIQT